MKKELLKIAYHYYPKGVNCIVNKERYVNSIEFNRLKTVIERHAKNPNSIELDGFLFEFNNIGAEMNFKNSTLFNWQDRCYTFDLYKTLENKTLYIRFYKSILGPYYFLKSFVVDSSRDKSVYLEKAVISNISDDTILSRIKKAAEEVLLYKEFDETIIDETFDDLNFEDIQMGKFSLFNAFFRNSPF